MTLWFAFENDGHVYELNGLAEKELVGTGAYGYATEQSALDHRNKPANPAQATLLSSFVVDASLPFGGGMAGVLQVLQTSAPPPGPGQKSAPSSQVTNTGKVGPGDILGRFNLASWFLRIGEVLLGLVLIGVGLARLTGTQNIISNALKTKLPIPIPV